MKVSTTRMKEAVNKVIKGAGNNNLIPITSMIGIKLSDGKLRLLTTDMTNTVCVIVDKVSGDDLDITVDSDKFSKLVAKTVAEDIDLTVKDDILYVKAGGTYKIPLISDEEGIVSFPDIESDLSDMEAGWNTVKLSSIMQAYHINRYALSKTKENQALTGYYCGDHVVTTDANVITFNQFKMFPFDFPVLISDRQMELLATFNEEDIKVSVDPKSVVFATDTQVLEGELMQCIDDFPAQEVSAYLDEAFTSSCTVSKDLLLGTLDRLALFIEPYDKNGAYFTFGRKGINIYSKKGASTETINYIESKDFQPFTCCVEIPVFKEQLQAIPQDSVKIYYGNENAIKLECGKVLQVMALLEDDGIDSLRE